MSTRIKDLFGYPKVVIQCNSGEDMLAVAETAKKELLVSNNSNTIGAVMRHPENTQFYWEVSRFRWVGLSDIDNPPLMFGVRQGDTALSCHFISVEEFFSFFDLQPTITEQEFSDAFCELIQGVANG